jgi:hypothetical protein
MRRSIFTLALFALCVALTPVPAHASFWKWLDDLSGPRFSGLEFELRVWCGSQTDTARRAMLAAVAWRVTREKHQYEHARDNAQGAARELFARAVKESDDALAAAARATTILNAHEETGAIPDYRARIDDEVINVLYFRALARASASEAYLLPPVPAVSRNTTGPLDPGALHDRLRNAGSEPRLRAEALRKEVQPQTAAVTVSGIGAGGSASVCPARPLDFNSTFMSVNGSYGWDHEPRHADSITMATVGLSFHWSPSPSVTLGTGFGIAGFSPSGGKRFGALYLQPYIIDVRFSAFAGDPRFRSVWLHSFYVRYNTMAFPHGFDPDAFGPMSPPYPKEIVHAVGIHFDFEPYLRRRQAKWWN